MIKKFINIFVIVLFIFLILSCEAFKKLTPEEFAWYADEPYIVKMVPPSGSDLTNDPPTPISIQFSKTMDKSSIDFPSNIKIVIWFKSKYENDTVVITSSDSQWESVTPATMDFWVIGDDIYGNALNDESSGIIYTYNVP